MKIELIETQKTHIPELMKLVEKFYQHFSYPFDYEQHTKLIELFVSNEHLGRIYLIQYQDQWIGYLALTFGFTFEYQGKDAFVDEFFIESDYRSKGIGFECFTSTNRKIQYESERTLPKRRFQR